MVEIARHDRVAMILLAIHLCLLVIFALFRLIDSDESFYLSAAHEVAQGRILYADFFYPQMPYLPYLYSLFAGSGFDTLVFTRLASAAAAMMTALLFYLTLKRFTQDRTVILVILTMFVFSGMVVSYYPVAKTYAWTGFLLMAAFYLLTKYGKAAKLWPIMVAGMAVALAVNMRLLLAPVIVLFLTHVLMASQKKRILKTVLFVVSMIAVSLPTLLIFLKDTKRFWFDNFEFHLIRNPGFEFTQSLYERLFVIGKMLINPQIVIILIVFIIAIICLERSARGVGFIKKLNSPVDLATRLALLLALVHLIPNPIHQHYFVQALPFALLVTPACISFILERKKRIFSFAANRRLVGLALVIYVLGIIPYLIVFIGGVRQFDGHAGMTNMENMCRFLEKAEIDGPVLAESPMVPLLSNRRSFAGTEFFGYEYKGILDYHQKRYYHLITNEELTRILKGRQASYYVVLNQPVEELKDVVAANYSLDQTFGRYKVYRRN